MAVVVVLGGRIATVVAISASRTVDAASSDGSAPREMAVVVVLGGRTATVAAISASRPAGAASSDGSAPPRDGCGGCARWANRDRSGNLGELTCRRRSRDGIAPREMAVVVVLERQTATAAAISASRNAAASATRR
ncbi:hypothetical protein A9W97_15325 [Mycobacterium gordonae]|nr:hypothetical protein A9W97_15325 [Mycobacterium gordonae]